MIYLIEIPDTSNDDVPMSIIVKALSEKKKVVEVGRVDTDVFVNLAACKSIGKSIILLGVEAKK
jgi:hypothetical protein